MLASDEKITPTVNVSNVQIQKPIKTYRIQIYDSPIFTVTKDNVNVHIILDTGATASLITMNKAKELRLNVMPTSHKAVQVDGVSNLKVLGEVHTQFYRGKLTFQFSGLVVGGTNLTHWDGQIGLNISTIFIAYT